MRTGRSAHRQHAGPDAEPRRDRLVRVGQAATRRQRPRSLEPDREIAVAEVEPHVDAELAQPVHHLECVPREAPAALVDQVREPERDQVRVGGHVGVVDLDVVAGVGDHDEVVGADDVEHARAPASRRRCRRRARRPAAGWGDAAGSSVPAATAASARDLDAGPDLVAHVDRDDQRRQLLDDSRHLERAAVDRRGGPRSVRRARRRVPCPRGCRHTSARPRRAGDRGRPARPR